MTRNLAACSHVAAAAAREQHAASANLQLGSSRAVFVLVAGYHPLALTVVTAAPGTGQWTMGCCIGPAMLDSAQVAFSWVHLHLRRLVRWLLPSLNGHLSDSAFNGLTTLSEDLQVTLPSFKAVKDGSSGGAAIATAVVQGLLRDYGIRTRSGCGITGAIDLCGRLLPVGDMIPKLQQAMRTGLQVVVAPHMQAEALLEDARAGRDFPSQELREYVLRALHPARTVVEAIQITLEGERA